MGRMIINSSNIFRHKVYRGMGGRNKRRMFKNNDISSSKWCATIYDSYRRQLLEQQKDQNLLTMLSKYPNAYKFNG